MVTQIQFFDYTHSSFVRKVHLAAYLPSAKQFMNDVQKHVLEPKLRLCTSSAVSLNIVIVFNASNINSPGKAKLVIAHTNLRPSVEESSSDNGFTLHCV